MELQVVSKETALLAKELGFDEECNSIYWSDDNAPQIKLIYYSGNGTGWTTNSTIKDGFFPVRGKQDEASEPNVVCAAPEQALLAMWLREKYKYVCHPTIHIEYTGQAGSGQVERKWCTSKDSDAYNTYEECLEAILLNVLNHLVSIKKEKEDEPNS